MKYKVMDGNEACSYVSYLFSEVAGIYPITPSSPMAEKVDELSSKKFNNLYGTPVLVKQMQSEAGAIAVVHGALLSGAIATTYTSSQGLLLMIPSMYKIAGECLPCVINVAARTVATHALSILGDHSDIYAVRQTGFALLSSSNVQDVMNLTAVSYLSSIKNSMPVVNFFDGFRTSHELKKIKILDGKDLKYLLDKKALEDFRNNSLVVKKQIRGTNQNDDIFFQNTEARSKNYDEMPDVVNYYMEEINKITGNDYKPFNYYGDENATKVIVAMGSICDTIKEVIKNEEGLGLVEVHLYRPFSNKYFLDVIPKSVKKIAVLDKTKEAGSNGEPLYLDVLAAFNSKSIKPLIIGGRYGLSGKDTDPACIKSVFEFLDSKNVFNSFTVGINDDVTNKSIPLVNYEINNKGQRQILIYGYASDGMVSASKDILTILGNNTDAFVQGYFKYDSKKSGGTTICNLRISKDDITSPYYIKKANLLVCTKDTYLTKYDMIKKLKKNAIFILVSNKNDDDVLNLISFEDKKYIIDNNIKVYVIDAYKIAEENNIKNKISTIMETAIFKIYPLVNFEEIIAKIKEQIKKKYFNKGEEIVRCNINAVDSVINNIRSIDINITNLSKNLKENNYEISDFKINEIAKLNGDNLSVSSFLENKNGYEKPGTSALQNSNISDVLPCWNKESCISCNMCSLICPHSVIKPYILTKEEVHKYKLENKVKEIKDKEGLYYYLGFSSSNCTGCSLCEKVCPNKAITMKKENKDNKIVDLIDMTHTNPLIYPKYSIKGSQFLESKFKYPGACMGCGQTAYIKLLTQLFGDELVIANATGCSSIYGGMTPFIPYDVSWANSLFEDNAEFGLGINLGYNAIKDRFINLINNSNLSSENKEIFELWMQNKDDLESCNKFLNEFDFSECMQAERLKEYIIPKSTWIIGGDGWAYDIGFSGIDQILSSGDNVNILVLDTEVYSNTGGQKSKSTRVGAVSKFAANGKKESKKDLARIAMCYENVYVANICLGANMQQSINALKEAYMHNGPSIIIAYAPCISHGIKSGMQNSYEEEKLAVECGYFPLFRYKPDINKLILDYKNPKFDKYYEFLNNENRYKMLKLVNKEKADYLYEINKENAVKRFNYYKELSEK